jgi:hypothetical protein
MAATDVRSPRSDSLGGASDKTQRRESGAGGPFRFASSRRPAPPRSSAGTSHYDSPRRTRRASLELEIAKCGKASVRRAYGDWTSTRLTSWKAELLRHSVQPIQQFSYTIGKNATDSALIIDAMDLLHAGNLDGFCLVSSDSDFTSCPGQEQGLMVYASGNARPPSHSWRPVTRSSMSRTSLSTRSRPNRRRSQR